MFSCRYVIFDIRCVHEPKGQAIDLATWNGKDATFLGGRRLEAGYLLRLLQRGDKLAMPHSRPMASIGLRCHELRINDGSKIWRIVYRIDLDAIVIGEVFQKKTTATPSKIIDVCKARFRMYDDASN